MSLLIAESLGRTFGDHVALEDFNIEVEPGSIVGIIGPSGGGKTTAIRLMCGLDRPDVGSVHLFGTQAIRLGRHERSRLALLAQDPALIDEMTITEQVEFAARLRRVASSVIDPVLARVGLGGSGQTRIADASGGMRRRAGLAAALIGDPDLAFLDEPTAGLDPILREQIWKWFRDRRARGGAMVVTTQHIEEAARCDRVIVLRAGRVIVDTAPALLAKAAGLPEQVRIVVAETDVELSVDKLQRHLSDAVHSSDAGITIEAVDAATVAAVATRTLRKAGIAVESIDTIAPGLDAVFRAIVEDA